MLVIMTNAGEYRTTETKSDIQDKIINAVDTAGEISFATNETSVETENGTSECIVTMTLDINKITILGFKEFEIGDPVIQETELNAVRKKYKELGERKDVLETAFDTPEFNSILEDEKAIKERKLAYHEKLKEQAKK